MLKKRLVFTLYYKKGGFYLSRNFRLQRVGDADWLETNYKFSEVAKSIDELAIVDVSEGNYDRDLFCEIVSRITESVFIPLVLGGGIRKKEDMDLYVRHGADKVIINTLIPDGQNIIKELVQIYGSQSIIASVDYRVYGEEIYLFVDHGRKKLNYTLETYLSLIEELRIGEIFLNSIDRDGSGQGYTLDVAKKVINKVKVPVVLAGGAGNQFHFEEALNMKGVDGVSTANLFNFIGDGLPQARNYLLNNNVNMAKW